MAVKTNLKGTKQRKKGRDSDPGQRRKDTTVTVVVQSGKGQSSVNVSVIFFTVPHCNLQASGRYFSYFHKSIEVAGQKCNYFFPFSIH